MSDSDNNNESDDIRVSNEDSDDTIKAIDVNCFLSPNAKEYVCLVCIRVPLPIYSYEHIECGAIYCKGCYIACQQNKHVCTKCKKQLTHSSMRSIHDNNKKLYSFFINLDLQCPTNSSSGFEEKCQWTGKLCNLEKHLSKECINSPVDCKLGCGEKLKKNEQEAHMKICVNRTQPCEFCNIEVKVIDMQSHIKNKCDSVNNIYRIQQCSYRELNCNFKGNKSDIEKHEGTYKKHLLLAMERIMDMQKETSSITLKLNEVDAKQSKIDLLQPAITLCQKEHSLSKRKEKKATKCVICSGINNKIWQCEDCSFYVCSYCHSIKRGTYPKCFNNSKHCMIPYIVQDRKLCSKCAKIADIQFWCPLCGIYSCNHCDKDSNKIRTSKV